MNYTFPFFTTGLFFLGLPFIARAADNHVIIDDRWSPRHLFCCEVRSSDTSETTVTLKNSGRSKSQMLLSTPRWANILWSPNDTWFCVDDNYDPDNNRLNIFHIHPDGRVERIWASLDTAPDAYWKLISWRMKEGIVCVQCDYAKDYDRWSKGWMKQRYDIPIFLPRQVTFDDLYPEIQREKEQQTQHK